MFRRPLVIGVLAFFLLLSGVLVFLWYESRTAQGLTLGLLVPERVLIGVPFDLKINLSNDSSNVLNDAKLTLFLPDGVVFAGEAEDKRLRSKSLGNLGAGSSSDETIRLLALDGENTLQAVRVTVDYLPTSLGGRFERIEKASFTITGQSVAVDITPPKKIFNGEDFEFEVVYKNISGEDIPTLMLTLDYPSAFKLISSSIAPEPGSYTWKIFDLKSGVEGRFKLKGRLNGPENAFYDLAIRAERDFSGRVYLVRTTRAAISVAVSPLSFSIDLNNDPNYLVKPGDDLNYTLRYRNGTDVALRDVIIRARLTGEMFDLTQLVTDASLRASDNTLIWTAGAAPELALLQPGASGSVTFRLRALQQYPIKRFSDRNFALRVSAEIESPTVPRFVGSEKTITLVKLESKVAGNTVISAQAFFRDANSGILNKGSLPLVVGNATQFTLHWKVTNFSNDIRDVVIRASLGGNARATGVMKSNGATTPIYNERTQELVWNIPKVGATKGVLDAPLEAIIQVEAIPGLNQVGQYLKLLQQTTGVATDDFTGQKIEFQAPEVTTLLANDPTVQSNQGVVKAQ